MSWTQHTQKPNDFIEHVIIFEEWSDGAWIKQEKDEKEEAFVSTVQAAQNGRRQQMEAEGVW